MIYQGMRIYSEDAVTNLLVCHANLHFKKAAIADVNQFHSRDNISKPVVMRFDQITQLISKQGMKTQPYSYPAEMSFSDDELTRQKRSKWLSKRDAKFNRIYPISNESYINQYLYGDGLAEEVIKLMKEQLEAAPDSAWRSRGAYYNALNRYIVFGSTPNALLPFGLKQCGSNYLHIEEPGEDNVKRGRGGADNRNSRSKSCGVTKKHKIQLQQVISCLKSSDGKFTFSRVRDVFNLNFQSHIIEREVDGITSRTYKAFDESQTISDDQIRYHFNQILSRAEFKKIKYGPLLYEKDHADRQGEAHDGVIGATHRYEIDATILDVYIRYEFDNSGRYTMGRPVLYLVIDVFSTMIVGMYLGFDGPNWQGASQAMVNACLDKVEFCGRFGIPPEAVNWPCAEIPVQVTVDNGNEHTNAVISSVLRSEIGIRAYNFVAVFRGDAKGIVERKFGVLNEQSIHFLAGSIPEKTERGEQHPSNRAEETYNSIAARICLEIMFHNNSANRIHKLDKNAIRSDIDITPQALYVHSLHQEMNGGRPSKNEDPGRIYWAFLPEETATVRSNGIHFEGLVFHSDYAKRAGWYQRARHNGAFKIPVKRPRDWSTHLWHKTPENEYICFSLKNTNSENPFIDTHWEPLMHLLEQFKDKSHQNKLNRRKLMATKQGLLDAIEAENRAQIAGIPESNRKSMQTGIKGKQALYKALLALYQMIDFHQTVADESLPETEHLSQQDDLDDELYL